MIYDAINLSDIDIRKDLLMNIVLAGSFSNLPGLSKRITEDLLALGAPTAKVIKAPDSPYQAWIGGSILASLSTFEAMWITKEEYDEAGPGIVHRKCF